MALTLKQRLSFVLCTDVSASEIVECTIDRAFLLERGISARALTAAKIVPTQLKQLGVECSDLPALGYVSLHLVDKGFCEDAIAAYGVGPLRVEFLQTPSDAVAIAGSPAESLMDVSAESLLELCAAEPTFAKGVLEQTRTLKGVSPKTLLDTGIRVNALKAVGYTAHKLSEEIRGLVREDLEILGFVA